MREQPLGRHAEDTCGSHTSAQTSGRSGRGRTLVVVVVAAATAQTTEDRSQQARGHVDPCLLQPRPPAPETRSLAAVVVSCRFAAGGEAAEDVERADGLQRPRVQLVRLAAFPEAEHAAAPAQHAGVGHVLHHLHVAHPVPALQHREGAPVREPPRRARRVVLLPLRRRLHVPRGVARRRAVGAEAERAEVAVAVERVHGGPVVVGEHPR